MISQNGRKKPQKAQHNTLSFHAVGWLVARCMDLLSFSLPFVFHILNSSKVTDNPMKLIVRASVVVMHDDPKVELIFSYPSWIYIA